MNPASHIITFTDEQREKLRRYADAKIAEKRAKAVIEELKDDVAAIVPEGVEAVIESVGKYYLQVKKRFEYSPKVSELKAALDEQIAREEADGTAVERTSLVLNFREAKPVDGEEEEP